MNETEPQAEQVTAEIIPAESPETEMGKLLGEEDPDVTIIRLEKIAELAPRWEQAMRIVLITATFPQDWEVFGDGDKAKACLSSAGAMRVAKHFPIRYFEVKSKKEEWTDSEGKAYRYIYEGKATLGARVIFAQGNFSTRDKFLGFKDNEWRDITEINEGHIRNAAYHIFMGNAVKELLGLRALPRAEYEKLMTATKQNAGKTAGHKYGKGTKGGTSKDETQQQQELAEACNTIVNAGYTIKRDKDNKLYIDQMSDEDTIREPLAVADEICKEISSFVGRDKKKVAGLSASLLKGQRLSISLENAKRLSEEMKRKETKR